MEEKIELRLTEGVEHNIVKHKGLVPVAIVMLSSGKVNMYDLTGHFNSRVTKNRFFEAFSMSIREIKPVCVTIIIECKLTLVPVKDADVLFGFTEEEIKACVESEPDIIKSDAYMITTMHRGYSIERVREYVIHDNDVVFSDIFSEGLVDPERMKGDFMKIVQAMEVKGEAH